MTKEENNLISVGESRVIASTMKIFFWTMSSIYKSNLMTQRRNYAKWCFFRLRFVPALISSFSGFELDDSIFATVFSSIQVANVTLGRYKDCRL